MRFRRFAAALAAASALIAPAVASAQATQPNYTVRDSGGAVQTMCAYAAGGAEYPCHLNVVMDASGNLHLLLSDTSGHPLVTLTGATPAGTNIIGKLGIDQTTPGTTNGVVVNQGPFTRLGRLTGAITLSGSSSYTTGTDIGGVKTLSTGLSGGTTVCIDAVDWVASFSTSVATAPNLEALVLTASPGGTFTDGSTVAFAGSGADAALLGAAFADAAGPAILGNATGNLNPASSGVGRCVPVDGSGNLYLTFVNYTAAPSWSGTGTLEYRVQYHY